MAIACIPLKRKGSIHIMKIDYTDWVKMSSFTWHISSNGYAARRHYSDKTSRIVLLHQMLLPQSRLIDHANGCKLDNRRQNLRSCTRAQNAGNSRIVSTNTSGHKGVSWSKIEKKWRSYITQANRQIHLGYFNSKQKASIAYQRAAKKYFGEFARFK